MIRRPCPGKSGRFLPEEKRQVEHDSDPIPGQNIVDGSQCPSRNHQIVDENDPVSRPIDTDPAHQLKVGGKDGLSPFRSTPGLLGRIAGPHNSGKGNGYGPETVYPEGECVGNGKVPTNESALGWGDRKQKFGTFRKKARQSSTIEKNLHRLPVPLVFCQTEESGHRTGIAVNNPDLPSSPDHLPARMVPDRIVFTNRTKVPLAGFRTT